MTPLTLSYKNSSINYYRLGYGDNMAICFHGYGETAATFTFLEKYAGSDFTLYSIDLPFHGLTKWKEGLNVTIEDLKNIIQLLKEQHAPRIPNPESPIPSPLKKLTLIGFSLGGRICLSLYEEIPGQIEKIVLLAPDGLKVNFWYWLPTQTFLGNKFFAFTMYRPGWFFALLQLLNKIGLINASIFKFVKHYINDQQVRQDLYQRWTGLRKIKPDIKKIKLLITKHRTPVRLIYGSHDRIILPGRGYKFKKGIDSFCKLTVLRSGHQVLNEKHVNEILSNLLH